MIEVSSFQDNFYITIETYHLADKGESENVHELDEKKIKKITVVPIDFANDTVSAADFKKDEDPSTFKSKKTGRGPLTEAWIVRLVSSLTADIN